MRTAPLHALIAFCLHVLLPPCGDALNIKSVTSVSRHWQVAQVQKHVASSAKTQAYAYPATDNLLLCFMVALRHKLTPARDGDTLQLGWEDPELGFWLRSQGYLSLTPRRDYLDVGCGMGRVVGKFGGFFDSTTCLEPDPQRVKDAVESLRIEPFGKKVTLVNKRFLDYEAAPASFDVITCVQVFQHLPLSEPGLWFTSMHRLLRPGGLLIVASTVAETTAFKATDARSSWIINATDFDRRARETSNTGALPVHHYTMKELADLALQAGFQVKEQKPFSYFGATPLSQYLIAVKGGESFLELSQGLSGIPPSPPVEAVHISGMESLTLLQVKQIRNGTDPRCKT